MREMGTLQPFALQVDDIRSGKGGGSSDASTFTYSGSSGPCTVGERMTGGQSRGGGCGLLPVISDWTELWLTAATADDGGGQPQGKPHGSLTQLHWWERRRNEETATTPTEADPTAPHRRRERLRGG